MKMWDDFILDTVDGYWTGLIDSELDEIGCKWYV